MPRPIKWRQVGFVPEVTHFKPIGIPMQALEEVSLSFEELEAIRLKDELGLHQEKCAQRMGISRPTFHRVLVSARKKIAEALTVGKAIRIEGGNFEMIWRKFRCRQDGYEWEVPYDSKVDEDIRRCPQCKTPNAQMLPSHGRGGRGRGRRWGQQKT